MSQGIGCKSKKLKESQEEWQKILLKWRRACGLSNLPWLLAPVIIKRYCCRISSSHYKLEIKTLSNGIEPWSVTWNCWISFCKLWFCRKLSSRESPRTPLDTFVYLLAYWKITWYVVTQKCNIVSVQNFRAKETTTLWFVSNKLLMQDLPYFFTYKPSDFSVFDRNVWEIF